MVHARISPQHAEGGVRTVISFGQLKSRRAYDKISIYTLVHPRQMFQRIPQARWEMLTNYQQGLRQVDVHERDDVVIQLNEFGCILHRRSLGWIGSFDESDELVDSVEEDTAFDQGYVAVFDRMAGISFSLD